MTRYIAESHNPRYGYFYKAGRTLLRRQTPYQLLEIIESDEFGRVLLLDGTTQVSEKNEWQYHEPLVHPALVTHPDPRSVCVIGGGDGGALREVLKHGPERAVQCDIDGEVMAACEEHLPAVNQGVFRRPNVRCLARDGRAYIEETADVFDVVIMDMTDPFGPSARLYTREYFRAVKARLRDDRGLFVMHAEGPISRPLAFQQILRTLGTVWTHQHVFYVYVQMYGTLWSIVVNGSTDDVATLAQDEIARRLKARGIQGLRVYTPRSHHAMQVGYPFIDALRDAADTARIVTDGRPVFDDGIDTDGTDDEVRILPAIDGTD